MTERKELSYCILDPTGNITALAEGEVPVSRQPEMAARIMRLHPEVEQVGFVRFSSEGPAEEKTSGGSGRNGLPGSGISVQLRMAGGEFCGNASMSAAALYLHRTAASGSEAWQSVFLQVSGAAEPVEVRLKEIAAEKGTAWSARVKMPQASGIEPFEDMTLVRMQGISHIIIEEGSSFFRLKDDRTAAEAAVRAWCGRLSADGLGLMFLEQAEGAHLRKMTPLVYVPGSGTVFWENSCASGSAAVGMYFSAKSGARADLTLQEPAGNLQVLSDPAAGETWLSGTVRLIEEFSL
jgi:diaminopimelate epimerase